MNWFSSQTFGINANVLSPQVGVKRGENLKHYNIIQKNRNAAASRVP